MVNEKIINQFQLSSVFSSKGNIFKLIKTEQAFKRIKRYLKVENRWLSSKTELRHFNRFKSVDQDELCQPSLNGWALPSVVTIAETINMITNKSGHVTWLSSILIPVLLGQNPR